MSEQHESVEQPRNAALDGLRALAVTAVVLFHAGVGALPGGFLGVDLFFVLSGFLITGLLLDEHRRSGRISLLAFWSRRARRLLPAMLVMVLAVVAVASLTAEGGPPEGLRAGALATIGYVANWQLVLGGGDYFAQQADPSALQHTWSLAIEEQFYLLWPLLVLVALRIARGRRWLVATLAATGLVASAAGTAIAYRLGADQAELYYRTDTRAQALLVGAVLAVVLGSARRPRGLASPALAAAAMAGFLALAVTVRGDQAWLYEGGFLVAALCSAGLVAVAAAAPTGAVGRLLGLWPLRWLGRISYGVYLWHWPVDLALTATRTGRSGGALLVLRLATTLALAVVSWFVIEQPIRRVARVPRRVVPSAALAGLAAAVAVLMLTTTPAANRQLVAADGDPAPASAQPVTTQTSSAQPTPTPPQPSPLSSTRQAAPTHRPMAASPNPPSYRGPVVQVTVLGDSVADSLASGLTAVDQSYRVHVINRGIVGCGIAATPRYRFRATVYELADACRDWEKTWSQAIARDHPKVALLVLGRHEVWDGELDGRWTNVGQSDFDHYLAGQLDRAIAAAAAGGAQVALATSPYFSGREAPDGSRYPENNPTRVDRFNALIRAAVSRHPGQSFVVELGRKCSPDGRYARTVDGVTIRKDGVHFSAAGARWLAPWLLPQLVAAAQ